MPKRNEYLLYVEDLYKSYGPRMILDDIDLAVRAGEFCTVVGPSGCGKSTLLRLILGQEQPTAGTMLIDRMPAGFPDPSRGIVFQRYSLYPHLTVLENVMLGLQLRAGFWERRRRAAEFKDRAMELLRRVYLEQHAAKYPHELSGGMQQRVAIAQAIIMEPRILMMDEPFGALDPQTREELQMFILELWESTKMTIFFVTHDLEEALYLASRTFVLSQHYTDDRGHGEHVNRGAKIVLDYKLGDGVSSPSVKNKSEFRDMVAEIRRAGFDPTHLQHVTQFELHHPDAFQTLEKNVHAGWRRRDRNGVSA